MAVQGTIITGAGRKSFNYTLKEFALQLYPARWLALPTEAGYVVEFEDKSRPCTRTTRHPRLCSWLTHLIIQPMTARPSEPSYRHAAIPPPQQNLSHIWRPIAEASDWFCDYHYWRSLMHLTQS